MKDLEKEIIGYRRQLHKNPEVSFCEYQTTDFIEKTLKGFKNFEITRLAKTGLVATIKATIPTTSTIAFRADIDALELEEKSGLDFISKNSGIMHACGHDAHTAIMLGFAKILSGEKDLLKKNIKLIFQRGEELAPGGANELVRLGVMENVEKIFALHVMPGRKSGTISVKRGVASANKNSFSIAVHGKGGHSSAPQNCIDPILMASSIVVNIQSIVARYISPFDSGIISLASFKSGEEYGVIPDTAFLTGAIRSFDKNVQKTMKERLVCVVEDLATSYGGKAKVEFAPWDYSAIYNDEEISKRVEKVVEKTLGEEKLTKETLPQSFSEDFSEYLSKSKGCMVWLGVGEDVPKLHSPHFNPDEGAFIYGAKYFHGIAKEFAYG